MPDLAAIRANLAFTCAREQDVIPPRDPEAEQLYRHARWLRKNNLLKPDPAVNSKIERLIRIATAYGHDKANLELRNMIGKGQAHSADAVKETLDLTQELIERGIPGGYYDMGRYLEQGYGVKQDGELALKYYRKSADLGSPDGQYLVGDKLTDLRKDSAAKEVGLAMWQCAAEQGHGKAAVTLGMTLQGDKAYPQALKALQLGVKAGHSGSAFALGNGFKGPPPTSRLNYLGQQKDDERAARYHAISDVLEGYSYLSPKVPEIDSIVPLPPAKLPPWDGKLQWLKEHEANVPPPLPSEARIVEMARAKGLDPATGRPLGKRAEVEAPRQAAVAVSAPALPLGAQLESGSRCPQTGTWVCSETNALGGARRTFVAGETLPEVVVPVQRGLLGKLKGEPQNRLVKTTWTLEAIPDAERGA